LRGSTRRRDKKNNRRYHAQYFTAGIAEQEHLGKPYSDPGFHGDVIRSYGSTLQTLVSGHLGPGLKQFLNQQVQGRERAKPIPGLEPPRVRAPQDEAFKSLTNVPTRPRDGDKDRDESNFTK